MLAARSALPPPTHTTPSPRRYAPSDAWAAAVLGALQPHLGTRALGLTVRGGRLGLRRWAPLSRSAIPLLPVLPLDQPAAACPALGRAQELCSLAASLRALGLRPGPAFVGAVLPATQACVRAALEQGLPAAMLADGPAGAAHKLVDLWEGAAHLAGRGAGRQGAGDPGGSAAAAAYAGAGGEPAEADHDPLPLAHDLVGAEGEDGGGDDEADAGAGGAGVAQAPEEREPMAVPMSPPPALLPPGWVGDLERLTLPLVALGGAQQHRPGSDGGARGSGGSQSAMSRGDVGRVVRAMVAVGHRPSPGFWRAVQGWGPSGLVPGPGAAVSAASGYDAMSLLQARSAQGEGGGVLHLGRLALEPTLPPTRPRG